MRLPPPLERLVRQLSRLPGIGRKTAMRLALFLVDGPTDLPAELAGALADVARLSKCPECGNIAAGGECDICRTDGREREVVCVVGTVRDLLAVEETAEYRGLYHVLGGVISPMRGIGPAELAVEPLLKRVEAGGLREVIIATGTDIEGEATAHYLSRRLEGTGVAVTRIAAGIPVGGDIEYTDAVTLTRAFLRRYPV